MVKNFEITCEGLTTEQVVDFMNAIENPIKSDNKQIVIVASVGNKIKGYAADKR